MSQSRVPWCSTSPAKGRSHSQGPPLVQVHSSQAQVHPSQAQVHPSQRQVALLPLLLLLLLLLGNACPCSAQRTSKATAELRALGQFLEANGYSTFSAKLKAGALGQTVKDAVSNNSPITILAPLDSAWRTGSPTCGSSIPTDTTLATHFIPGTLNTTVFDKQPNGFIIGTLTAVPILKASSSPRRVVITTGTLKVLTRARIVRPKARESKWVLLHGIDAVLQYPCTF